MKRHVVALGCLALALASQACNLTVDLPKTLPSILNVTSTSKPLPGDCVAQLKEIDADGDGAVNITEFYPVLNPPRSFVDCPACGAPPPPRDPQEVIKKYDRNGDGKLQQDEYCAYMSSGKPTPSPTPPMPSPIIEPPYSPYPTVAPTYTPTPTTTTLPTTTPSVAPTPTPKPTVGGSYTATPAPFDDLDTDKDGKVSWDEEVAYQSRNGALPAGAKDKIYDLFRQADTNQNGTLERAEYDFARS